MNNQNAPQMKTVAEFLSSPQPLEPIPTGYSPYPDHMVAGTPAPPLPHGQVAIWDSLKAPVMTLRTLFARAYGSSAR